MCKTIELTDFRVMKGRRQVLHLLLIPPSPSQRKRADVFEILLKVLLLLLLLLPRHLYFSLSYIKL